MKVRFLLAAAIVLLVAPFAMADALNVVSGDAAWRRFESPAVVGGTQQWNRASYDGTGDCNIGFWLSGVGGCSVANFYDASPRLTPDFLGNADTRFGIKQDGNTASVTITTGVQVTDWVKTDVFGWYLLGDPANTMTELFGGGKAAFGSATFVPSGDYGFYLTSKHGTYFSAGSPETKTHFAVFRIDDNSYRVGAEDMWRGADWDYNDLTFAVQFNSLETPEPMSLVLLGTGLFGIGAVARRKRNC